MLVDIYNFRQKLKKIGLKNAHFVLDKLTEAVEYDPKAHGGVVMAEKVLISFLHYQLG